MPVEEQREDFQSVEICEHGNNLLYNEMNVNLLIAASWILLVCGEGFSLSPKIARIRRWRMNSLQRKDISYMMPQVAGLAKSVLKNFKN